MVSGRHGKQKAVCEFCGRRHNAKDDICDVRTKDYDSGNSLEKDGGAYNITLNDLNEMVNNKRELVFELIINTKKFEKKAFCVNMDLRSEDSRPS